VPLQVSPMFEGILRHINEVFDGDNIDR